MTGSAPEPLSEEAIPTPLADDDDDVSWALKTAAVQWKRGQRPDAIQWVRRAAESAAEIGNTARASDLEHVADELAERVIAAASAELPPPNPTEPPPSVRAILDSIHETLEEAASEGLMPDPVAGSAPLTPPDDPSES